MDVILYNGGVRYNPFVTIILCRCSDVIWQTKKYKLKEQRQLLALLKRLELIILCQIKH